MTRDDLDAIRHPEAPNESHACCATGTDHVPEVTEAAYVCPMCSGVASDGPGDCPVCGMDLVFTGLPGPLDVPSDEEQSLERGVWTSALMTVPVVILSMGTMVGVPVNQWLDASWNAWIQLALTSAVILGPGRLFFVRGWQSVVRRSPNMYTLIMLGVGAAYGYSLFLVLVGRTEPLYFESAAVICTFILLGQYLEARARQQTQDALHSLMLLTPRTARRLENGLETDLPVEQVKVGDELRVRPGENVPVDGVVTAEQGYVNESAMTGESVPVTKRAGDPVMGGTLNESGSFLMRARSVGAETVLAQMIERVADAQRRQPPVQKAVDVVARYFVPSVTLVAFMTLLGWLLVDPSKALNNACAVLIIACPCALGLATPLSIAVGIGEGARHGLLLRDGEVLQRAEHVTHVVFDKTGTLTQGRPVLTDVVINPHCTVEEAKLFCELGALEQRSEHPIGRAIFQGALERGAVADRLPDVEGFENRVGEGVRGRIHGQTLRVGRLSWIVAERTSEHASEALRYGQDWMEPVLKLEMEGATVVAVADDNDTLALLGIRDPVRETTHAAIQALRGEGLTLVLCTGDSEQTANAVARELGGIDDVHANCLPSDKQARVRALQDDGAVVAFVGDGINDAPALAESEIGIAMGTGTDTAMQTAGATLVKGDLNGVLRMFRLSEHVMQNIRQNLIFAFGYNMLGIPIAAGVLYPLFGLLLNPMIAGGAMSASSLCVVTNARRLQKIKL